MYSRYAIMFPLTLVFMMALITFWINQTVQEQGPRIDGSNRHDPDYRLHNFVTTQSDVNGKLRYVLAAAEMTHFPDDDTTVLQRPKFTQFSLDKPYTQIQGLRGYVSSDGETVEFVDNVKVIRQATADKGQMQLLTEKLTIEPNKDLATTQSPVTITQAPKTKVTAVGMVFDKKNQTMTLLNKVRVHYERPTPKTITPVKPNISTKTNSNKQQTSKSKRKISTTPSKTRLQNQGVPRKP
jgi:lipopolysaccharide export system protein LptC